MRQYISIIAGLFLVLLVSSGFAMAQTYTAPTSAPTGGNAIAPVSLGSVFQSKNGNFWANNISASTQFCIGASCIVAWPKSTPPVCTIESKQVSAVNTAANYADACGAGLTASAKALGWVAVGADSCAEDGGTCTQDSGGALCFYQRMICDGVPVSTTQSNSTAVQEMSAGFLTGSTPPPSGGGGGGGGGGTQVMQ